MPPAILAILLALAESGLVWEQRVPWLIQTLTGIERGKYYFFQSPGNVTVPMN